MAQWWELTQNKVPKIEYPSPASLCLSGWRQSAQTWIHASMDESELRTVPAFSQGYP